MSKVKTRRVHLLLVKDSYYPSCASEVSDNRMYHSSTGSKGACGTRLASNNDVSYLVRAGKSPRSNQPHLLS